MEFSLTNGENLSKEPSPSWTQKDEFLSPGQPENWIQTEASSPYLENRSWCWSGEILSPWESPSGFQQYFPSDTRMRINHNYSPPLVAKPALNVVPHNLMNFTSSRVRFTVQVLNIPGYIFLNSSMIQGMAVTPSGKTIPCEIHHVTKADLYQIDSFTGTFKSNYETGLYRLRLQLVLTTASSWSGLNTPLGSVREEVSVLICRNYYRKSLFNTAKTFPVTYEPWSRPSHLVIQNHEEESAPRHHRSSSKVWGIACDKLTNRLFYTDRNSHTVHCVDSEGQTVIKFPAEPSKTVLNRPTGICCDDMNRRVLITDKDNHRVTIFSIDGQRISSFGTEGHKHGMFSYPWGIAVNSNGTRIAVADSRNKRVQLFDGLGNFLDKFSIYEQTPFEYKDQFDYPRGITFNSDGSCIYVSDFNVQNVMEVQTSDMRIWRKVLEDGKLRRPQGLVMDSMDTLLVCDSKSNLVRHIFPSEQLALSQITNVAGHQFQFPIDLTTMANGHLAVLDGAANVHIF